MTPSVDLAALFDRLAEAARGLPTVALVPGEARALGGSLFAHAPLVVDAVGRALVTQGDLFPDLVPPAASMGQALLEQQARARRFFHIAALCQRLHKLASEAYLVEQAGAIKTALCVIAQTQEEAKLPFATAKLNRERRLLALFEARRLLRKRTRARPRPRRPSGMRGAGSMKRRRELSELQEQVAARTGGGGRE